MTPPKNIIRLLGEQFGIVLQERGENDPHVIIQLLDEDDENWFEVGQGFSSYWIDDLIDVLQRAKTVLETNPNFEPDPSGYGQRFSR